MGGSPDLSELTSEPLPISRELREQVIQRRQAQLAEQIAVHLVEPVENLIAERFNQPLVEPVVGRVGYQDLLRGTDPAAGSDFRYRVPGTHVLWPLSVMCRFTTSAVVAERTLALEYQDTTDQRYLLAGAPVTASASDARSWVWHPVAGNEAWPVEDAVIAPLPQQHIYPTHSLVLRIGNVQAGDQLDQVRISCWLYPTGPQE